MALDSVPPRYVSAASLALVINCSVRCLRISSQTKHGRRYRDIDGEATLESELKAAKTSPWTSAILALAPILGLAASILGAVTPVPSPVRGDGRDWTGPVLWALLVFQANLVSRQKDVCRRYKQSITGALSALTLLGYSWYKWAALSHQSPKPELIASATLVFAFLSFPRRPVVFYRSNKILHEKGVSVLDWFVFSWGLHPDHANLPDTLSFSDLPRVAYSQSARGIRKRFDAVRDPNKSLWRQLARAGLGPLILKWFFVFMEALSEFGIRFAMHRLLQRLEGVPAQDSWVWMWVAGIAVGQLGETVFDNWGDWVGHEKLQLPLHGLVQSLIFEKMMRVPSKDDSDDVGDEDDSAIANPIDLLGDDSTIIGHTFNDSHEFPLSCFKVCLNAVYLSSLLGFDAVLLGATLPVLAMLISHRLTSRYQKYEKAQSKASERTFNLISEALQGLRQIRLSSMERFWQGRLFEARNHQQDLMWFASLQLEMLTLVANLGPVLFASATISLYAYKTGSLSPSLAFTSLNLFGNLHAVFKRLPHRYAVIFRSKNSFRKIQEYLDAPEQVHSSPRSEQILLRNASLAWPGNENEPVLRDVNLSFPKNELSLVVGKVGSGKSLLLAGVLGEAVVTSGQVERPRTSAQSSREKGTLVTGSTAYVSQPPWIEDAAIRENILFGYVYDETRYQKVLDACALRQDLETLSDGDLATAGKAGSTLSGGQKWRVALARALYSPAEIVIMEDILGAVDAPIARIICDNALQGELAWGRTIILATHHPDYCMQHAGYLVTLEEGSATGILKPTMRLMTNHCLQKDPEKAEQDEKAEATTKEESNTSSQPQASRAKTNPVNAQNYWRILSTYIQTGQNLRGYFFGIFIALIHRLLSAGHSWWLAKWSSGHAIAQQNSTVGNIAIYMSLSVAGSLFLGLQTLLFASIGHTSSKVLFERLVKRVLSAKLSWIDGSSPGQVVQTLGSDMYAISHRMAPQLIGIVSAAIQVVFISTTTLSSSPYMIAAAVMLFAFYINIALRALKVASRIRPLMSSYFFPLSDYAESAKRGLTTIRAFGRVPTYIEGMQECINIAATTCAHQALGLSWLGMRLGLVGTVFVTAVAAAMVYGGQDAASTGFAITLALQLRQALSAAIGQVNVVRTGSNALDRVLALTDIPAETGGGAEPGEGWPPEGAISVQSLTVRHDPSLPPALRDVSFTLQPGKRLGVVGRTGAGKTTLTNAMVRFIEASAGRVVVDGEDISRLPMQRVREAISVIPQDPFLFSGTLRSNMDLYGAHSDAELLSLLRRVQLLSTPGEGNGTRQDSSVHLEMAIRSSGSNLSHGQRQLICLARVMLENKCRILILDEATSGIDGATETAVQRVIRDNFADKTILVVAHKLLTVADFDSLLVLSEGEVVEAGSPGELLRRGGRFCEMVEHSGDGEKIREVIGEQDK